MHIYLFWFPMFLQAVLAQKFGCKGLLIYNDPSKYAPSDTPLYPDGPSLPQFGIQRGSLLSTPGDPATPSLPSIGENFFFFFFFWWGELGMVVFFSGRF